MTRLANFFPAHEFCEIPIFLLFGSRTNSRNILAHGERAGIDGDQCSRAKAQEHGHPCRVGEISSLSPARWHQRGDKLQHFNPLAPVGSSQGTQTEIKLSHFLDEARQGQVFVIGVRDETVCPLGVWGHASVCTTLWM